MKFVGDTLSFSNLSEDGGTHTVRLPFYHRAAVGVFPGTRIFAVPLPSTNEVVLTPIDPSKWGDIWRLEAMVSDQPGSAKSLVETLVDNDVNVLVHEGVSESAEQGKTVHQIFEILDLAKYSDDIDGNSDTRNHVGKSLLKPNHLLNRLIGHSADCLEQAHEFNDWELRFNRMEFFFRNKETREQAVALSLNVDNEVHVPVRILKDLGLENDVKESLPLHIISDTEQKYVKLRVLSPKDYYLLFEIEHAERIGAIDEFMDVLKARKANMIDSYSRLKSIAHSALFYTLAEFSGKMTTQEALSVVQDLVDSSLARAVVLKGAVGDGPSLERLKPKLPTGATIRTRSPRSAGPPTEPMGAVKADGDRKAGSADAALPLGIPYYLDRHDSVNWTLNTATVFMAIPFSEAYREFYDSYVAAPVRDVGLEPSRADDLPARAKRRHIIDRIEEGIARSRFVIADVTKWNPNVVYEVGLAVGISKPLLLLCEEQHFDADEIPFDFQSYELIKYSPWQAESLKGRLMEKIRELKEDTEIGEPGPDA